ncbi:hypothetical protein MVEN_00511800 [Mycena venus]|uniref:Alpha/beta hydrolase fold-3 domain-containing protein n=1 Tax=Mycena venus TaxID=2733690 RepID=A0A8H6YI63_9AGAR|nr:hypothetical protein MVEN_00511800 [Mycena venus]
MIDHLFGRPNPYWKRAQVFLIIFFLGLADTSREQQGSPIALVASTLTAVYVVRNFDKILGLQSPEPLANLYSPSYYRATWINTGLDAGFATAMSIRTKWIRDICSVLFSGYYIVYPDQADQKMQRFRAVPTVEMLRRCWEKTSNPYIRAFTHLPRVTIRRKILLPRPTSSTYERPITGYLFFALPEKQLSKATDLILDFPGGGFVAMSPEHHEASRERLRMWAITTGKPVLSIDYGKAPECTFKASSFSKSLIFSKIHIHLLSTRHSIPTSSWLNLLEPSSACPAADSTFSSLATRPGLLSPQMSSSNSSSTTRTRQTASLSSPAPIALVFNYAALDFNFTSWMTPDNLRVLRTEESLPGSLPGLKELAAQKDHLKHVSPLSMVGDTRARPGVPKRKPLKRQTSWKETIRGFTSSGEKSGGEKSGAEKSGGEESTTSGPRKRRSSSSLKTPSSRRSTFLEPKADTVATDQEDEEEDEQDYAKYREEDRPIQARVRYVYPDATGSGKGGVAIPRSKSAVVKQQHELSVAVEEANTKATERYGGKGKRKEPIGTRLTMTSRTGYFQDRVITPSMMRAMAILYIGPHRNPDFATDYHLSPILAPAHILAQFPPILMQCGEKDPLVDDTVIFAGRVREAKRARKTELDLAISGKSARFGESLRMSSTGNGEAPVDLAALKRERDRLNRQSEEDWVQLVIWSEWSHGYLQMPSLMAEAKAVIEELAEWIDGAFERYAVNVPQTLALSRRRDSPATRNNPARKPIPHDSFSTSETDETDDSGITFVPRRRTSPPESLNGSLRTPTNRSPTETSLTSPDTDGEAAAAVVGAQSGG